MVAKTLFILFLLHMCRQHYKYANKSIKETVEYMSFQHAVSFPRSHSEYELKYKNIHLSTPVSLPVSLVESVYGTLRFWLASCR